MRTSRIARWLISGALVTAAAVAVHGGQTVESSIGAQALSSGSANEDTTVVDLSATDDEGAQPMTTTGYEWG